jgi:gamma-glutamylcyclotransferase (GGCT)/AIG2-like uncharacterized protein YtfP
MINHLFVYGILRRDFEGKRHPFLSDCDSLGEAYFSGKLYDLGAFPGAVPSDDLNDRVKGEVYRLHQPEAVLAKLDEYEGAIGADPLYRRELVDIILENGKIIKAWVYVFNGDASGFQRIESGDYVYYLTQAFLREFEAEMAAVQKAGFPVMPECFYRASSVRAQKIPAKNMRE